MASLRRIKRELKYQGKILDIYSDYIEFENGNNEVWDHVEHRRGGAAVLPILDDGRVILVRQYRNSIEAESLEIPAGARNYPGEPSSECAARELEEETGYRAGKMKYLYTIATTPAFCNERIDVYVAEKLLKTDKNPDENEYIEAEAYRPEELLQMILSGRIQDGKTVGAILAYMQTYR